jgi:hypothetical protein
MENFEERNTGKERVEKMKKIIENNLQEENIDLEKLTLLDYINLATDKIVKIYIKLIFNIFR